MQLPKKKKQNKTKQTNKKNYRMISVHFQGNSFNIKVIQDYDPMSNDEEAEV